MVEDDILTNSYSIDEEESNRVRLNSGNGPSTVTNAQSFTSAAISNSLLALPKELGTAGGEVDPKAVLFNVFPIGLAAKREAAAAELQSRGAEALRPITRAENGNSVTLSLPVIARPTPRLSFTATHPIANQS